MPTIIAGGASSAYYLHLHQIASHQKLSDLSSAALPTGGRRVVVLSPHCDDETLGAGALIADARRENVPVTVAFLTNGDGFRVAASRALHEVALSPDDFVRFAEERQQESLAALRELGVDDSSVKFLGYPDRGLKPMWEQYWSPSTPYRSAYTRHIRCPYPRAYTPHTLYCGEYLVEDLVRLFETTKPTDVYVTHPSDDHPDHLMAPAYAEAALHICRENAADAAWTPAVRIHYYIVHRGDWPLPQGLHPSQPLLPPSGMARLDTRWSAYNPSPAAIAAKRRALEKYVSQTSVEARFLRSFIRRNELFGELADNRLCTGSSVLPASATPTHDTCVAVATAADPAEDDLIRFATPAADITGISVRALPSRGVLQILVHTRGRPSRRVRYTAHVRSLAYPSATPPVSSGISASRSISVAEETSQSQFASLPLYPASTLNGVGGAGGGVVAAEIPLRALGVNDPQRNRIVWISADTRLASRLPAMDWTGYRAFTLEDTPTAPGADRTPQSVASNAEPRTPR